MKKRKIYFGVPKKAHSNFFVRFFFKTAISLVAVFILFSIAIYFFLDLNEHKAQIEDIVKKHSDLKININGNLRLTLVDKLRLSVSDVKISFQNQKLVVLQQLKLSIDLLALFKQNLQISNLFLQIDKLNLKAKQLQDLKLIGQTNAAQQQPQTDPSLIHQYIPELKQIAIDNIQLSTNTLIYSDEQNNFNLNINNLNFQQNHLPIVADLNPQQLFTHPFQTKIKATKVKVNKHQIENFSTAFKHRQGKLDLNSIQFKYQQLGESKKTPISVDITGKTHLDLNSNKQIKIKQWEDIKHLALQNFVLVADELKLPTNNLHLNNSRMLIDNFQLKSKLPLLKLIHAPIEHWLIHSKFDAKLNSNQVNLKNTRLHNIALRVNNDYGSLKLQLDNLNGKYRVQWDNQTAIQTHFSFNLLSQLQINKSPNAANNPSLSNQAFKGSINLNRLDIANNELWVNVSDKDIYRLLPSQLKMTNFSFVKNGNYSFKQPITQTTELQIQSEGVLINGLGPKTIRINAKGSEKGLEFKHLKFDLANSHFQFNGLLDLSKDIPLWHLQGGTEELQLGPMLEMINQENILGGKAQLSLDLNGEGFKHEITKPTDINGHIGFAAKNLQTQKIDLDKLVNYFEDSQGVGLLDIGAYVIAGPAGVILVKGNDYNNLRRAALNSQGSSNIAQLQISLLLENGVLNLGDTALATTEHLLAAKGSLDLIQDSYQDIQLATIDNFGCIIYKEKISGPLNNPQIIGANRVVKTILNPINSVITTTKNALTISCKEPFYHGRVSYPGAYKPLQKKLIDPINRIGGLIESDASDTNQQDFSKLNQPTDKNTLEQNKLSESPKTP